MDLLQWLKRKFSSSRSASADNKFTPLPAGICICKMSEPVFAPSDLLEAACVTYCLLTGKPAAASSDKVKLVKPLRPYFSDKSFWLLTLGEYSFFCGVSSTKMVYCRSKLIAFQPADQADLPIKADDKEIYYFTAFWRNTGFVIKDVHKVSNQTGQTVVLHIFDQPVEVAQAFAKFEEILKSEPSS